MKVGAKVKSTKVKRNDLATITSLDISKRYDSKKNREVIQSKYTAKYDDGSSLIFYGFDIGKTVFTVEEANGQITLNELERLMTLDQEAYPYD